MTEANPTSNRKTVPTFEGRLYTLEGNHVGNWVRRAEADSLLDEIERLRKIETAAQRCVDIWRPGERAPQEFRDLYALLSGDSSAPEFNQVPQGWPVSNSPNSPDETNAQPPLNFRSITTSVGGPNDPTVAMRFSSVEDAQAVHHWLATLQCAGSPEETSACLYESQDGDTLTYETTCGNIFRLDPVLDLYEFCPYCGKRVTVKASKEANNG